MKKNIIALLALVALFSCQKEITDFDATSNVVKFTSAEISPTRTATDASGTEWSDGDQIGIYAFDDEGYTFENVAYKTSGGSPAAFSVVTSGEEILYSNAGTTNFYGYYPYQDVSDGKYAVNVGTQTSLSAIDFLVSDLKGGEMNTTDKIALTFAHKLSYVSFSITANTDLNVDNLQSVTIKGINTTASYDLDANKDSESPVFDFGADAKSDQVTLDVTPSGYTALVDAILIPSDGGFTLEFEFGNSAPSGGNYIATVSNALESGKSYAYSIYLDNTAEVTLSEDNITDWVDVTTDSQTPTGPSWSDLKASTFSSSGSGNFSSDPYIIETAAQLACLAYEINNNSDLYVAQYFKLANDINLGEVYGAEWVPIGISSNFFKGHFDGNNCTVSGMLINSEMNGAGLFGFVNEGSISNLTVEGSITSTGNYQGGIVGSMASTSITNCTSNVTLEVGSSSFRVGGIAGRLLEYSSITNCTNTGNISVGSSSKYIGGIAGCIYGSTLTNSTNQGTITAESSTYVGGICGTIADESTINSCANTGAFAASSCDYVGGILGGDMDDSITTSYDIIINCSNSSDVNGSSYVGGLVGQAANYIEVVNSYNRGDITGTSNVGGLIGAMGDYVYLTDCYTTGDVSTGGGLVTYSFTEDSNLSCYYVAYSGKEAVVSPSYGTNIYSEYNLGTIDNLTASVTAYNSEATTKALSWRIASGQNDGYPIFVEAED